MSNIELLPCPFCASEDIEFYHPEEHWEGERGCVAYCLDCGVEGKNRHNLGMGPAEAAAHWNRRPAARVAPDILDAYNSNRQAIFDHLGYVEDWCVLPLEDSRDYFWTLHGEGPGQVGFSKLETGPANEYDDHYENEIYTQRHLPKWVYRGAEYTMVVVDTRTDGNKFLQVFRNCNERPSLGAGKDHE